MNFVITTDRSTYADFALWGPHQGRIWRKLVLVGMVLRQDGLKKMEMKGPPTFSDWNSCFLVRIVTRNELLQY